MRWQGVLLGLPVRQARGISDRAFKAELIANPAAALEAEGIDMPSGMALTVVENADTQFHLVLRPSRAHEMSDVALDSVAGGIKKCGWGNEPCLRCGTEH